MNTNSIDLAPLLALHAAATEGNWTVEIEEYGKSGSVSIPEINRILHDTEWADPDDFEQDQANAQWIAEAHNRFPALAAELEALRHTAEINKGIYEATLIEKEVSDRLTAWVFGELGSAVDTRRSSESEIMAEFRGRLEALRARVAELERKGGE